MDPRYALFRRSAACGEGRMRRHRLRSLPYLALPLPDEAHAAGPVNPFACARRRRTRSGPL